MPSSAVVRVYDEIKQGSVDGYVTRLRDAVAAMETSGTDLIAVTDAEGTFIGLVAEEDIVKLDEILDETGA